jgi:hypothetical protein
MSGDVHLMGFGVASRQPREHHALPVRLPAASGDECAAHQEDRDSDGRFLQSGLRVGLM